MKHCGACKKQFKTAKELVEHLKVCICAKAGKSFIEQVVKADLEPNPQPIKEES